MSNDVFANTREISCKAGQGKSICCFPDVCMTPPENPATPPGVPIPYPNTGMASDTTDGSRTVKISGKEVMLKDKSYFKKSVGDEAGCAAKKGVVTSVNRGKVYFIMWSMDVIIEGENVVRHMDNTSHNHASPPPNIVTIIHVDTMAGPEDECGHPEIVRESHGPAQTERGEETAADAADRSAFDAMEALERQERKVARFQAQAAAATGGAAASARAAAAKAQGMIQGLTVNWNGAAFESDVATETKAKEWAVVLTCRICGQRLAEYDVLTEDDVVKECKNNWGDVSEEVLDQKLRWLKIAFPTARDVHFAVPRGARPAGDRGALRNKQNISNPEKFHGRIQEH